MGINEERIAAIYERDKNLFFLDSTAMVDYNIITKKFKVLSGKFRNKQNKDFNILTGSNNYINSVGQELKIKNNKKEYSIFIFDNRFIDQQYDFNIYTSVHDIFVTLTRDIISIFLSFEGKKIKTCFDPLSIVTRRFTDEEIEQMLSTDNVEDISNNNSNMINNQNDDSVMILPFGNVLIDQINQKSMNESNGSNIAIINNNNNNNLKDINVKEIIQDINKKIVGQEKTVATLVSNIYYNQVLIDKLCENDTFDSSELDSRKISILLDGSTGTGKTAILKEIASKLDVPIDIVNANSFSETGYVGPTITDILSRLLDKANGNVELAERGIIVLDEIDKIANTNGDDIHDMKKGVQEELLSFISGGKYDISVSNGLFGSKISFDTSKITFILSGAFTKLRDNKIIEHEKSATGMGFNDSYNNIKREYEITPQDYINYGLMREFFGRIKVLTSTKSYTIEDLKKILLNSEISPLKNLEKTVQMFGYKNISYSYDFVNKICKEAYNMDTGARGLQSIMASIQNKILMNLINQSYDLDEPVEINEDILSDCKKDNIRTYTKELVPKNKKK